MGQSVSSRHAPLPDTTRENAMREFLDNFKFYNYILQENIGHI